MRPQSLQTFFFVLIFLAFSAVALSFAEGYLFSREEKKLVKTGVLNLPFSFPGASLFLDGEKHDGVFPLTLRIPPGGYRVRIEKDDFLPWEKNMVVSGKTVSEIKEIFTVPKELKEGDFLLSYRLSNTPSGDDFFLLPDKGFAYLSRAVATLTFFNLRTGVMDKVENLPFLPEKILDLNREGLIFQKGDGATLRFEFETGRFQKTEASFSSLKKPPLTHVLLPGDRQEVALIEKGKLVLRDLDLENTMSLFEKDVLFLFGNGDNGIIAAILPRAIKIFSLRALREREAEREQRIFFSRFLSRWVPAHGPKNAR